MTKTRWTRGAALLGWGALTILGVAGCGGGEDFENKPRPPVPVQITGVITNDRLTVSPSRVGAGPLLITVSNQTTESHTITLEGTDVSERVGPVNPADTATIQKTLPQGVYEVKAGSDRAVTEEIDAGTLEVGPPRKSGSDEVLLP